MKKSDQIKQISAYVTQLEIKIDNKNEIIDRLQEDLDRAQTGRESNKKDAHALLIQLDLQEEKIKIKDNIIFNMTTELDKAKKMIAAQENAIRQCGAEHRLRHQAYNL